MFDFVKMKRKYAKKVAEWKYGEDYYYCDFYGWKKEKKELKNGLYFAVTLDKKLAGFVSFGPSAQWPSDKLDGLYEDESYTDIGMGLDPALVGSGFGEIFCSECCDFAKENFPGDGIRLTVDSRNERAMHIYEKLGFKLIRRVDFEDRPDVLIFTKE